MKIYIYTLKDPISNEIRYVGKTNNLRRRYYHHCSKASYILTKNHKSNWILSLLKKDLKPIMEIIEEGNQNNWIFLEQYWIAQFRAWGFRLVNSTDGGEGVHGNIRSEETRSKISKNNARARNKKVYKFSLDGKFLESYDSTVIAGYFNKINPTKIAKCCRGEQYTAAGFAWSYNKMFIKKAKNHNIKSILQYDLNMNLISEYDSITKAAITTNIQRNSIKNCCLGKLKTAGKFKWKYKN